MTNTENICDKVRRLSALLPGYVESRMPYTYHHDYIRWHIYKYYGHSRADIAKAFQDVPDEHLYSIAFLQVLSEASDFDVDFINKINNFYPDANEIISIAFEYINKIL